MRKNNTKADIELIKVCESALDKSQKEAGIAFDEVKRRAQLPVWSAAHHHRHGVDFYVFRCESLNEEQFQEWLGDQFEDERTDEWTEVSKTDMYIL